MHFIPLERMWERVEVARDGSDSDLFHALMYFGEFLSKVVTSAMVGAVETDPNRHRYRQLHTLVRASGLGEWDTVLSDVLSGPASQHLNVKARVEQSELITKCKAGTWQYEAVSMLHWCLSQVKPDSEALPAKVDGRRWFAEFSHFRNKTRGHGAVLIATCSSIAPTLEQSMRLVSDNLALFQRSWAFLHQNLSGKYRVTRLSDDTYAFDSMRREVSVSLPDGVYTFFDGPTPVELLMSDVDAQDFYLPNGSFDGRTFEVLSYISGKTECRPADRYLAPVGDLPASETQGTEDLDAIEESLVNLPPRPSDYIHRTGLETVLRRVLLDDHHSIVTLVGRGGVGKTSLALTVLHDIAQKGPFESVIWFSSRDIDLLPSGPKLVRAQVLGEREMGREFVRLLGLQETYPTTADSLGYFERSLTRSQPPLERPILFVFDNFETVHNPLDLFVWLDNRIRLPNKILITTRVRDFRGDYPVEVEGMTRVEFDELVSSHSGRLGIERLLTSPYLDALYLESDGHPYVVKVLLGEVANAGRIVKVDRILANKDEILEALFERTFSGLSLGARRLFLTLCKWRSVVPVLALQAVLLRPSNERMDVDKAVEELQHSSFVEVSSIGEDGAVFVSVPKVSRAFGSRKLSVSPLRSAIESDTQLLRAFGAAQFADIRQGLEPRVESLFRYAEQTAATAGGSLEELLPVLEFVARNYHPAYLRLSSLHEQQLDGKSLERAKNCLRAYLEYDDSQPWVWEKLACLCQRTGDIVGQVNALVTMCQTPGAPLWRVSQSVNTINNIFRVHYDLLDTDEKRIVVWQLAETMESQLGEAGATDLSRLAWLYLHLHDEEMAWRHVTAGLRLDPENEYCRKLRDKLEAGH